ncbi:unnamed protein product [Clonostachys rosea f. rosea IK726]|jgi:RimJ/RimL family protein N-acetyltransferase|uniref:Uncharacterized protein n=1 Tax=Clonostachys rosea f. rosea IK726 TaxID=1349383 RepID=A0ACA9UJ57_BIOOC|nr:unnamed protein product [Clonostachys rosea f. rosea IK726]
MRYNLPASEADTEAFHQFLINPKNFPHQPTETSLSPEQVRTRIGRFVELAAKGKNAWLVFILRETGEFIGYGGFNTFEEITSDQTSSETEPQEKVLMTDLGVMIDHRYWRKGYGTEIMSALTEFACDQLGCGLVRVETGLENEPWRALSTSMGLGAYEDKSGASYDPNQEVLVWKYSSDQWKGAKDAMVADGNWRL